MGWPPISTSGFGIVSVCSRSRVPRPPHRITTGSLTARKLLRRAGRPAPVEDAAGGRPELEQRAARFQDDAKRAIDVVASPRDGGIPRVQGVARPAAGPHHVLADATARAVALEVVVVAAQDDARAAGEAVPERVEVGGIPVGARAVARSVPERDPAVAGAFERALEPAELWRAGPVLSLRVEVEDLPPRDPRPRPGRLIASLAGSPVRVVAGQAAAPLVVPDGRVRDPGEAAQARVVPAAGLRRPAGLVDIPPGEG